jgi:uncharacterized membrane protein YgdD (TMEM256/DUF423 family)
MEKKMLQLAALSGAIAVILGAFGAHGLKAVLSPESLLTFDTGVKYQFYHSFAMLATYIMYTQSPLQSLVRAFYAFGIGILLFSGSLYFLATRSLHGVDIGLLGLVTPIGGVFFIGGWIFLFFSKSVSKA